MALEDCRTAEPVDWKTGSMTSRNRSVLIPP
jgi:hypothetical protein